MTLTLTEIHVYPVKSMAGGRHAEVRVDDRGPVHDRRFMVVDAAGRFVTQREHPEMARLAARIEGDALVVSDDEGALLRVPVEAPGDERQVTVWGDTVAAVDVGEEAAGWLSGRLGCAARLVRMPRTTRRRADPRHARAGELVSFADGFPFLLIGLASLSDLNARLPSPVDMRRFRPNLVVAGAAPYAEDGWERIAIGGLGLRVASGCSRCVMVDVDPDTGQARRDVLSVLAEYRRRDGKVWFGVNAVHEGSGILREGDAVTLA